MTTGRGISESVLVKGARNLDRKAGVEDDDGGGGDFEAIIGTMLLQKRESINFKMETLLLNHNLML